MQSSNTCCPIICPALRLFSFLWAILFMVTSAAAQKDAATTPQLVDGPMKKLAPILGSWEIDAKWESGGGLTAKNEYKVGVGGRFVEAVTFANDPTGKMYQRYLTVFGYDADAKQYMSWGFTFDGTQKTVPVTVEEEDGKLALTSQWEQTPGMQIKQTVTLTDTNDSYNWQVWSKSGEGEWTEIMEGTWKRVS